MSPRPIGNAVFADDPNVSVARVGLGLTVYTSHSLHWAQGAAARVLSAFLASVPREELRWFATSRLSRWQAVTSAEQDGLVTALAAPWLTVSPRHLFRFRIVDDPSVPLYGFSYTEIDTARSARAGVIEITLPQDGNPDDLLALANVVAHEGPFHCGVGGYAARWNPQWRPTAFDEVHDWARRYIGVDVQDPEQAAWLAPKGLIGTGWLTLIGAGYEALDLATLATRPWGPDVLGAATPYGVIVRAGERPTVGDLNRGDLARSYAVVARAMSEHVVDPPVAFVGAFRDRKDSRAWMRRFVEPEGWR